MKIASISLRAGVRLPLLTAMALSFVWGCGSETGSAVPDGTAWGGPFHSPISEPFQGNWKFHDRPETEKETSSGFKVSGGPDLRIDGHIITQQTPMGSEFRLFDLHEHGGRVCGKAWFHEDPHDPGDMSKVFITMAIEKNTMTLRIHYPSESVGINDPDLQKDNPVISSTPEVCPQEIGNHGNVDDWEVVNYIRVD